jgi:hypothetical protein
MSGEVLLAAWRDATFLQSHGQARRYHVLVDGLPACNRSSLFLKGAMLLCDDMARPAASIDPTLRCRRPGCARLWPVTGLQP